MTTKADGGLFCELYWGTNLAEAWSYGPEQTRLLAAPDEKALLPLYGFTLPEEPFLLAEHTERGWRVHVPPAARVERSLRKDAFREVPESALLRQDGRVSVELLDGMTLRLTEGHLSLVVERSVVKEQVNRLRLRDIGGIAVVSVLFLSLPVGFLIAGPDPERMAASNARAIQAAQEKEAQRRKALGVDTPLRPLTEEQRARQGDGGTQLKLPASLGVH